MLVTATNELKFHQWPNDGPDEPYNLTITADIISLSWSKDNNFLIYTQNGGKPEILSLKDINNIKPIHIITAIDNATVALFQRKTKRCVAIGTSSATVALYDTKTKSIVKLYTVPTSVECLDFNAQDEYLAVACSNGAISLLNVKDGTEACNYSVGSCPTTISFHHSNCDIFAVGTKAGCLFCFNINEPNPTYIQKCHTECLNGLAFLIKQEAIITVGEDCKFCVHDMGQSECTFRGYQKYPLTCIDITTDGKHFAIGSADGTILIYEVKTLPTPLLCWNPHHHRVSHLKFSNGHSGIDNSSDSITVESSIGEDAKIRDENDFKSLYSKYLNKSNDDETLKLLKDDIVNDIVKDANQLHSQMNQHMANLQEFIKKEFEKMAVQMDDKWDLLNMLSGNYKSADDLVSEPMYDEFAPIID